MKKILVFITVLYLSTVTALYAQTIKVAVAANAQFVIKELQADFKKNTGLDFEVILGSSGKLAAQIKNGAPYDVFLSADTDFPNSLYKDGFGLQKPKIYASGSLIICSATIADLKNWKTLLTDSKINKIAIANPELAPYGKATQEALEKFGLWKKVSNKIVLGESISQVNTYVTTGAADIGFTTEALVYEYADKGKLNWLKIDDKAYGKINQSMLLLTHSKLDNLPKALKLYNYLSSASAKQILKKNGYKVP